MGRGKLVVLAAIFLLFSYCGKKGPPHLPLQGKTGTPLHVTCSRSGGSVVLAWQCDPEDVRKGATYVVLRGQVFPETRSCRSCPGYFVPIRTRVPCSRQGKKGTPGATIVDPGVEPGRVYEYRVQVVYGNGARGRTSPSVFVAVQ